MTVSDLRNSIVFDLVRNHGASRSGFKSGLREIAELAALSFIEECADDDDEEAGTSLNDEIQYLYEEWFGDISVVPAAFRIDPDPSWKDCPYHVHVWEVELSARISDDKLQQYGRIADGEGPLISLHLVDRGGLETIVSCNSLMPLCYIHLYPDADRAELFLRYLGASKQRATPRERGALPTVNSENVADRAILRAVKEMGLIKPQEIDNVSGRTRKSNRRSNT